MTAPIDLGWMLSDVADAIGGSLIGEDRRVRFVTTDSREASEGALFVAIEGERFDGHDFAAGTMEAGSVGVIVRVGFKNAEPRIEVEDTLDALLDLGAMRRAELTMPVVAITGSTGKTSTKDLLAAGIEGSWASPRSYNNEIGVPLTVLGTPSDATVLILEVGSRGPGHIRSLAEAVKPDVSVITNLGVVHLETFGTEEGLADAKFELIEMLGPDGAAVLPADEGRLLRGGIPSLVSFGESAGDVTVSSIALADDGKVSFTLTTSGVSHPVALAVAGYHQALNAAAAAGAATALGLEMGEFTRRMGATTGSDWRMDVHIGDLTVVNDAYNANPQSVEAALRTVAAMPGNRHIAVLGTMSELGSVCEIEHRRMGEVAVAVGFDRVIIVGPDHGYALGARELVTNAAGLKDAADTLQRVSEPGDVVLVKASRSAGLERLALDLVQETQP